MANLVLPDEITIQLIDSNDQAVALENVLFTIKIFARHKNDFSLGSYVSDSTGRVIITNEDLRHEVSATYDSGCMDYAHVEDAFPMIEIQLDHPDDIERCIQSRTTSWKSLLKGETERFGSIEELIDIYRNSTNHTLNIWKGFSKIRDEWDGSKTKYHYDFRIQKK